MLKLFTVAVVLLALAACAVSGSLHGVCAEGECTELSLLPGRINTNRHDCYDTLPDGTEWTERTDPTWLQAPSGPKCIDWKSRCNNDWREDCHNVSQDLWPHLDITLEHYNEKEYGIVISWEQPANVTGYVLQMTEEPSGVEGCNNGRKCNSVSITSPTYRCVDDYPSQGYHCANKGFHVKLIPTPWCDGPSIYLPAPQTCHNIRPGDCETCRSQEPLDISPPTNVNLTPLPHLRGVFLTWEPGESYYGLPYPNISFFLKITYTVNDSEATPRLRVTGRTNLTLQNLILNVNYTVEIRAYDCGCGYDWSSPVYFYLNESSVPSPSTSSILAPTSTLHPHSMVHPHSSTSHVIPTPSMSLVNSHQVSPHVLAISLTIIGTLIVIIAIAVTTWKMCASHTKPPPTPHYTPPSTPILISPPSSGVFRAGARVLLIFSLETPRSQQEVILQLLGRDLQNCCMEKDGEYVYPEVVWYDRSKLGRREGMAQWVEREVRACDKVLCVCNKEFKREWEGEIEPIEGSLVSCIKRLYLGSLNEASSKYAVVFMNAAHRQYYLPTIYFRTSPNFLCEKDSVKEIAHYILGVSTYCLPEPKILPHIRTSSTSSTSSSSTVLTTASTSLT